MTPQNVPEGGFATPFFTVLIPTMNRPQLVESALASVLWQTFQDFEVIISDNSNSDESLQRTRRMLEGHASDQRVHYIRPPRWMNMPDHWEFASRETKGRYVLVLTDRFVMRPSALTRLREQIAALNDDIEVVSWDASSHFLRSGVVHSSPNTGTLEIADSHRFIREFARLDRWNTSPIWVNRVPRILNSCYRNDVAERIRKLHGRLFLPLAPDYTAGYLLLAYAKQFAYFDCPLYMSHGGESNGQQGLIYGYGNYLRSLGADDWFAHAPTSLETATNIVISDFLMVRNLVGDILVDVHIDLVGYFMCNYRELMQMERLGSQRDLGALYRRWWDGVSALSRDEQRLVRSNVKRIEQQRVRFIALRRLIVRTGLGPSYNSSIGGLRKLRHRIAGKPVYENVLEAARSTDSLTRN